MPLKLAVGVRPTLVGAAIVRAPPVQLTLIVAGIPPVARLLNSVFAVLGTKVPNVGLVKVQLPATVPLSSKVAVSALALFAKPIVLAKIKVETNKVRRNIANLILLKVFVKSNVKMEITAAI